MLLNGFWHRLKWWMDSEQGCRKRDCPLLSVRTARHGQLEFSNILELKPGIFGVSLNLLELGRNVRLFFGSRRGRSANY